MHQGEAVSFVDRGQEDGGNLLENTEAVLPVDLSDVCASGIESFIVWWQKILGTPERPHYWNTTFPTDLL